MRIEDRITGVLEALNKRSGPFTEADTQVLTVIAAHAALALRNANQILALARAYEKVNQFDKLKTDFLAVASHELRTPLSVILGYGAILQEEADPALGEHVDVVLQAGAQMNDVIEAMTDLSLLREGATQLNRTPTCLQRVLQAAHTSVTPLLEKHGHRMDVDLPALPVVLNLDPDRLRMTFEHLMKNAVQYAPGGSSRVCVVADGEGVRIDVQDEGIGIPPAELEKVFDEFYQVEDPLTRSHGGLGLGLTIARHIVHLHEGRICAGSEGPGTGTTVSRTCNNLRAPFSRAGTRKSTS